MNKYLFLLSLILGCVYVRAVQTMVDEAVESNQIGDHYPYYLEADSMDQPENEEFYDEIQGNARNYDLEADSMESEETQGDTQSTCIQNPSKGQKNNYPTQSH